MTDAKRLRTDFTKRPNRAEFRDALDQTKGTALILIHNPPGPDGDAEAEALLDWLGPTALPRIRLGTARFVQSSELPPGVLVRIEQEEPIPPESIAAARAAKPAPKRRGRGTPERVVVTAAEVGKLPAAVTQGKVRSPGAGAKLPAPKKPKRTR